LDFVETVKSELGFKAAHQPRCGGSTVQGSKVQGNTGLLEQEINGTYALRERSEPYGANFTGKSDALSSENTRFWNENSKLTPT
jgi:hypothetical protein